MKHRTTLLLLIGISLLCTGCNVPWSRELDAENRRLAVDITAIKARLKEIPALQNEIDELRRKVVEAREKKDKFLHDHPGLEEFIRTQPPDLQVR